MTQARQLLRSFAGGEITPELFGRLDLSKFQTGLALAQNFRTLPHGPAARRPGTRFVNHVARSSVSKSRLIPFAFSADQTMVIEVCEGLIRFHTQGGTLIENAKTVTGGTPTNPAVFTSAGHGYTTGQVIYATNWGFHDDLTNQYYTVTNATTNTFQLARYNGSVISLLGDPAFSNFQVQRVYEIGNPYAYNELFDIHYAQSADVLTMVHPSHPIMELRRLGAISWQFTGVSFASGLVPPTGVSATVTLASSTIAPGSAPQINEYVVTSVSIDNANESLISASSTALNNLNVQGAQNLVSWSAAAGAVYYNVYRRRQTGGSYGFIGQTTQLNLSDDNVLPDLTRVPPEQRIGINSAADDYPSAVTYGEGRRWFAATNAAPQTITASRVGSVNNLYSSVPAQDNDAMRFTIASQQQNRIRHLVWLSDLLALTAGGEFRIFSQDAPAITPTTLTVKPQGYAGASNVQPALTTASVLYVQAQGGQIRELSFNGDTGSFATINMSVMAPHLFEGHTVLDMAFVRSPEPTLYVVRDDGVLLGLTYVPEQQVYGWHRFVTDGRVESVCVVAEGAEDALYMTVLRSIDNLSVRSIERMARRYFEKLEDCYFVDNGRTINNGFPTNTVYGLWHLNGKTVQVLGDGADLGDYTVANGRITLSESVTKIQVGVGYVSDLKFLPQVIDGVQASGQGAAKNINRVHMKLRKSSAFKVGPSFDKMDEPPMRDTEDPYGQPPELFTGEVATDIRANWSPDGDLCVRQDRPLPLTVVSVVPEIAVGR